MSFLLENPIAERLLALIDTVKGRRRGSSLLWLLLSQLKLILSSVPITVFDHLGETLSFTGEELRGCLIRP